VTEAATEVYDVRLSARMLTTTSTMSSMSVVVSSLRKRRAHMSVTHA